MEDGRIRRAVTDIGIGNARAVRQTGLLERLSSRGWLLPERAIATELAGRPDVRAVYEYPRIPFVSYPYEWPFAALKAAALLHLDIQLEALDAGVALTDATAYNIQFVGAQPVFIDHLSFRPYHDGELWAGHRQFCEQFLHPLLLRGLLGVEFQSWYRGHIDGIAGADLAALLGWRHTLDWRVFINVVLPARLQRRAVDAGTEEKISRGRLSRAAFRELLSTLHRWIARLEPRGLERTTWSAYDSLVPASESAAITGFVGAFVSELRPRLLWDLGCNAGRYSAAALAAGADYVIGLDSDAGAIEQSFHRARDGKLRLLSLLMDLVNPSPGQGWLDAERDGLLGRDKPDALLAIAVIHHLALARNVPLGDIVTLLTRIAPEGVIGFVPATDARAAALFRGREDLFRSYSLETFLSLLQQHARVVRQERLPGSERTLIRYSRR